MMNSQGDKKKNVECRICHVRNISFAYTAYLDIEEGGFKRGKNFLSVSGAFCVVDVEYSTNTVIFQLRDVIERRAMNEKSCSCSVIRAFGRS